MKVVIYGAGTVGTKIAETLYKEKHDITIIDNDEKKIEKIQKSLDVLCVIGNIGDEDVLEKANINGANIFIAVSDSDEENIIACLIAKRQKTEKTIARVRNPAYISKEILDAHKIGIDHFINPEREVAKEIMRIIRNPWASEVDPFLEEQVLLIEVKVNKDNLQYLNKKLKLLCKNNLVIIIESMNGKKKLRFFEESKKIELGNHIFVLEKKSDVIQINKIFEDEYRKIQNVIIMGGGTTGEELLKQLDGTKLKIKLIEKSKKRCDLLTKITNKSLILCEDGTDLNFLVSENIGKTDCFVAITGDDEDNIMISLLAKQKGVEKTIAKISKDYEDDIVAKVGLDATVNINKLTVNKILRFVRRKELVAISILDEEVEIMEFSVSANSKIVKKPLKKAQFVEGAIIGAIYHKDQIFFPRNHFKVEENDKVLIFVHKKVTSVVEGYFMAKK